MRFFRKRAKDVKKDKKGKNIFKFGKKLQNFKIFWEWRDDCVQLLHEINCSDTTFRKHLFLGNIILLPVNQAVFKSLKFKGKLISLLRQSCIKKPT